MKAFYTFFFLLLVCGPGKSQDTHYWTQQFGTRSALMGGAVIASGRDNSSLYYNPGSLGWIDTASLSINANAYQNETIKIKNALGQKADFNSSQIGTVPLLLGGMIRTNNKTLRIGYGILAQSSFNFKANARIEGTFPLINDTDSPGDEGAIGQVSLQSTLSELGTGIGIGKKISNWFSIGITGLFIVRSADYSRYALRRAYMNKPGLPLVSSTIIQTVDYYNVRFQPKLGLAFEKGKWQMGLTVAAPSFNLFGNGNIAFDATATNILLPSQSNRIDFVANDRQEKLKTKYKSPFSIGAGVAYNINRSHIELAAQYFGGADMYSIINAESSAFARPANAYPEITSDKFLRVLTAAKPVFNLSMGYEYQLKANMLLYASLRSNQSFFEKDINRQTGIKPDISSWDIYHIVVGSTVQKGRSSISFGITTAFGKDDNREQTGNINNDNESNLFLGSITITEASYSSIGLLLGYTYHFRKF